MAWCGLWCVDPFSKACDSRELIMLFLVGTLINHWNWFFFIYQRRTTFVQSFVFILVWVWMIPFLVIVKIDRSSFLKEQSQSQDSYRRRIAKTRKRYSRIFRRRSFVLLTVLSAARDPSIVNDSAPPYGRENGQMAFVYLEHHCNC